MRAGQEEFLRRLALNDEATIARVMSGTGVFAVTDPETRTPALARIAALIAVRSPSASYQWAVDSALAAGATETDIVDVLIAVAPIVGLARATSAAPELALALGYDLDAPVAG